MDIDIQVRSKRLDGTEYLVNAKLIQRGRKLLGKECVLVQFGPNNRQWMDLDSPILVISEEARNKLPLLCRWSGN